MTILIFSTVKIPKLYSLRSLIHKPIHTIFRFCGSTVHSC